MNIGTYYQPEQWPRHQWERDFDNIERLGMQVVIMGGLAWFEMEPEEGKINFDWLSDCVEMALKRDLKVILCTPTSAPPIWLVTQHPEILMVGQDGERSRFGGHYNPLAPALVEASKRIVTALADHFGKHPAVVGWQIGNSYSQFDQSELTHQVFQSWLEDRYATIDALNQAWGSKSGGAPYTDFSQVLMPPSRQADMSNPHQRLDGSRFWSWALAQFAKVQSDILKPRIGDRFITANFMPLQSDVNPDDFAGILSLYSSLNQYPTSEVPPTGQTFRMAEPSAMSLAHETMASYTGRWGLSELLPGQIHRGDAPVLLHPGAIRLWIWTAVAHGAEFVTTCRFRQSRSGAEMFDYGLVGTDGVTPSAGGREFSQTAGELRRLEPGKLSPAPAEGSVATPRTRRAKTAAKAVVHDGGATVGMYVDVEQLWSHQIMPQARRWDYDRLLRNLYGSILRLGLRGRVLRRGQPIPSDLKLLILPAVQMVDEPMIESWTRYVANGGNLLMTCRTALMDMRGQFREGPLAQAIQGLIGGSIEAYDGLPEPMTAKLEMDETLYEWGAWGDLLYDEESTHVLARYADQFYEGAAAIIQKEHGPNSSVTYCGVFPELPLAEALVEKLARSVGLPVAPTPRRVNIIHRGSYHFCLNYQDVAYEAPAGPGARFVVGDRTVESSDVAVWEE